MFKHMKHISGRQSYVSGEISVWVANIKHSESYVGGYKSMTNFLTCPFSDANVVIILILKGIVTIDKFHKVFSYTKTCLQHKFISILVKALL